MALGWLYISYDLENNQKKNNICSDNFSIESISSFGALLTIIGSKIFQKIFRDTWSGNASHGAFFGFLFYICLISEICNIKLLLESLANTAPVLFFMIRMGNFMNNEHYINIRSNKSKYIAVLEGIMQGPFTYIIINYTNIFNFNAKITSFVVIVSLIRILFEFLRDSFDIKNIVISISTIIASLYLEEIVKINTIFYLLLILDIICKNFINKRKIVKNFGFNFSLMRNNKYNKLIHLLAFIICNYYIQFTPIFLGSISNLSDRLLFGYVIDYIRIPIYPFKRYCFNIADILVTGGLILKIIIDFYHDYI